VLDNELTISSYSLGGGGLLHIRDLSHNAMLMDNMELPLHNCSSNHFCLDATFMAMTKQHIPKGILPRRSGHGQILEFFMPFQNAIPYT